MKTLALNILDIVQNSLRAKADEIGITITELADSNIYTIEIRDNGDGIAPEMLDNVTDPFITSRTKRKMGLGLSLLKHHATIAGGTIKIFSEIGIGTIVTATFEHSHIDRQPLGDIAGVLRLLIASNPRVNFTFIHKTDFGEYRFSSRETKDYLDIETFNDIGLLYDIGLMINGNLANISASGIDLRVINHD
jgi:hypothetical protein